MAKLPRLDEVFLVTNPNIINVGSAYSHGTRKMEEPKRATTMPSGMAAFVTRSVARQKASHGGYRGRRLVSEGGMKPELEKLVKDFQHKITMDLEGDASTPEDMIERRLREFAHALEKAEGEDPAELDQGGPPAGSTGGR
jgi:hypothetical protein